MCVCTTSLIKVKRLFVDKERLSVEWWRIEAAELNKENLITYEKFIRCICWHRISSQSCCNLKGSSPWKVLGKKLCSWKFRLISCTWKEEKPFAVVIENKFLLWMSNNEEPKIGAQSQSRERLVISLLGWREQNWLVSTRLQSRFCTLQPRKSILNSRFPDVASALHFKMYLTLILIELGNFWTYRKQQTWCKFLCCSMIFDSRTNFSRK